MQKEITIEMIDKFNEHMEICNSIIILSKRENENIVDITLSSRRFIESFIINPTEEFHDLIINYFKQRYMIDVSFNNVKTTFWSTYE